MADWPVGERFRDASCPRCGHHEHPQQCRVRVPVAGVYEVKDKPCDCLLLVESGVLDCGDVFARRFWRATGGRWRFYRSQAVEDADRARTVAVGGPDE